PRPWVRLFRAGQRKRPGANAPRVGGLLAQVGRDLLRAGRFAAAEPYLRECLAIREAKEPDAWTTFDTRLMLGGSLLGQQKSAAAEPLLVAGYDGLKRRADKLPTEAKARLPET